jgi:hypothetical protein
MRGPEIKPSTSPFVLFTGIELGLLVGFATSAAHASSNRGKCLNKLRQLALAIQNHQDDLGILPTDICAPDGTPLLSWRVRLLPYLECDYLYKKFHLDEPWDSPVNRRLLEQIPSVYRCPSAALDGPLTCYVIPGVHAIRAAPAIGVVEVDEAHAVIWTKPEDLKYDPETPHRGLCTRHSGNFACERGGFAALADGRVRFIPATLDPDWLRSLFAGKEEGRGTGGLPWDEALTRWCPGYIMVPSLAISLCGIAGLVWVVPRLIRRKPTSPGEMLWLITCAGQLAHVVAVLMWYRYRPVLTLPNERHAHQEFWLLPSCMAMLASIIAVIRYRSVPVWRTAFVAAFVLFAFVALDDMNSHSNRATEESFLTAASPVTLGLIGGAMACLTLAGINPVAWSDRRFAHWLGISISLLPFIWFAFGVVNGWVVPRELFMRVRE